MIRLSLFLPLFFAALLATNTAAAEVAPDKRFDALLDEHWARSEKERVFFRRDPDSFRMNGTLPSVSAAARQRRQQYNEAILARLDAIDPAQLSPDRRISYRIFRYEREAERASYAQPGHLFPFTNRVSWQSYFVNAPENMSFLNLQDYEDYLVSLADYPRYNAEHLALLEEALARDYSHYCEAMTGYEQALAADIVDDGRDSALYRPFTKMPDTIGEAQQKRLRDKGLRLIEEQLVPAFREFHRFYVERYAPNCRKTVGVTSLDGGEDYYRYLVGFYTTTDMTPKAVHELGLAEVKRIRGEMEAVIEQTGFEGSFRDFVDFLREDPRFYTDTAEDLLEKVSRIAKRMDGQLPRLFGTLPRNTYDIKPVPAAIAERTTGAYYVPAPGDGRTPGTYFINTSKLDSRPLYVMEALSFHEAVPGHHLQNAIAQEADMPTFRRFLNHSAYTEGWGLYSERLGLEAGFYSDPYSNFGRLTYEMWRACRLVVDTGMHAFGWSRQRAIDYMVDNTALSIHAATAEIDRYITWPAQALSYKIGELKIRELRHRAEQALGADFDLREFHDLVLANGSMPIAVLESVVDAWLTQ
jgi:uncharacterized protein (DUF885 family)